MKLSTLLNQRALLLRQARLANLAFAHETLGRFIARAASAQLRGAVTLRPAAPELERYGATLTALEGSQSVLEEHFTEEDVMDLADVIAFVNGRIAAEETFRIGDVADRFLRVVRAELECAGVTLDAWRAPNDVAR